MPTCKECGFTAPRLQWTHFKFKCTGKFNNGREYQAAYPGAKLVDDDLAKRSTATLKNMIQKYGEQEGQKRWDEYRARQAHTNSFEYKQQKHGWTREQFEEYNRSRSVTLENLIARHGELQGVILWQDYCERQAYTNTLAYFQEKHGVRDGTLRYQKVNKLKGQHRQSNMASKIERLFVDDVEQGLGESLDFSIKTKQYCLFSNNRCYFFDIVHKRKAIEFNGDYWHCNPQKYPENYYHPHIEELAGNIWKRDADKINLLEAERKIPTLQIWESDYVQDPEQTIRRCVEWLTGKE